MNKFFSTIVKMNPRKGLGFNGGIIKRMPLECFFIKKIIMYVNVKIFIDKYIWPFPFALIVIVSIGTEFTFFELLEKFS